MRILALLLGFGILLLAGCSSARTTTGHDPYAGIASAIRSAVAGRPAPCVPDDRVTCVPGTDVDRDVVPALTAKGAQCTRAPLKGDNADCRIASVGPDRLIQDFRSTPPVDGRAPNSIGAVSVYGLAAQQKEAWAEAVEAARTILGVTFGKWPFVLQALTHWISGDPNVNCGTDNPKPPVTVSGYQLTCLSPSANQDEPGISWLAEITIAAPAGS